MRLVVKLMEKIEFDGALLTLSLKSLSKSNTLLHNCYVFNSLLVKKIMKDTDFRRDRPP